MFYVQFRDEWGAKICDSREEALDLIAYRCRTLPEVLETEGRLVWLNEHDAHERSAATAVAEVLTEEEYQARRMHQGSMPPRPVHPTLLDP